MRIKRIDLDDDGMPLRITASMTIWEAALLAQAVSRMTGEDANELIVNGSEVTGGIHAEFAHTLFARYWEGGLEEAVALLPEPE